jgi:YebC/PmpR family DNA-binding regulatory protein
MAGHSKWANIRHRKGAQDKKRGKIYTKLIREITSAAKLGGADPNSNPRLRLAIDKARAESMPKDNIERAIARAAGDLNSDDWVEIRYEGYGPGGAAVMVECMTDNRNRTAADVRHAFSKYGGNLGSDGSVAFLFEQTGVIAIPAGPNEEEVMEAAIEGGARDVLTNDDGSFEVLTEPADFEAVREILLESGLEPESAEVTMRPTTSAELDEDQAASMVKMLDMLEDLDDVQDVHTNADISGEFLERLERTG